jgi:nucleotide-binding universal stress UspA family protein
VLCSYQSVVHVAQERGVDLIVIGSRERHGVSILFNFTETPCCTPHPATCWRSRLQKG